MEQSGYQSTDQSMDQDDGRWLTYPELAAARGIDKASAIRLATRKHWRRQRDNRRVVRVLVPPEWLSPRYQSMDQSSDDDMDRSSDRDGFGAALATVEAAHAGEVAALHGQIAGLKTLADSATARLLDAEVKLNRAEALAATERGRADQERLSADRFRDEAEAARMAASEAEQAARIALGTVEQLRQADDARRGRGRLRRVLEAWRGR
jgi:hypothetical protein